MEIKSRAVGFQGLGTVADKGVGMTIKGDIYDTMDCVVVTYIYT